MKLELYIRSSFLVEVELNPPVKDKYLSFQANYEIREQYVNMMIEAIKIKYQRAIENSKWEIFLVIEEPVLEPQIILN